MPSDKVIVEDKPVTFNPERDQMQVFYDKGFVVKEQKPIGIPTKRINYLVEKYKTFCVLMPTYKLSPAITFHSFATFYASSYKAGFMPDLMLLDQTNILVARNTLLENVYNAQEEYKNPYKVILMMDSDHGYDFGHFIRLLDHYDQGMQQSKSRPLGLLSARYLTRDVRKPTVCAYIFNPDKNNFMPLSVRTKESVVGVDGVGLGFALVNPELIKMMYEVHGQQSFSFSPVDEVVDKATGKVIQKATFISEDLDFCLKAKKLGFDIWLDNTVNVDHVGGLIDVDDPRAQ